MCRSQSLLTQSCSTSLKPMVGSCDVCPPSSINSNAVSPVNAARLVQLANVAIDSHENALDCRVDTASLAPNDGIKSEDGAGQSCDAAGGSLVADGQLSRGTTVVIMRYSFDRLSLCCSVV